MIYVIGFLAQALFSARILVQWVMSERARRVVSPTAYWALSLVGSILLFTYGWLRSDFSIILGQLISYYIYIWNLDAKGLWRRLPLWVRLSVGALPVAAVTMMAADGAAFVRSFLQNDDVPLRLVLFGSAGQVIFTVRFVYQWYCSRRRHQSVLPVGFWAISLLGSGIIIAYGIVRRDPVLVLGQSVGFVAYLRNIVIARRSRRRAV